MKFINLIIHDTAGGFGLWVEAIDAEVYGCLAYYNGWTAPDRGSGHGFYVQNLTGNSHIADNIIFSNFTTASRSTARHWPRSTTSRSRAIPSSTAACPLITSAMSW